MSRGVAVVSSTPIPSMTDVGFVLLVLMLAYVGMRAARNFGE
jgi:hypothetical protein